MQELVKTIIADKNVSVEEVESMRELILQDGVVTEEEIKAVWQVKDSGSVLCPEFADFAVEAVAGYCLGDGVISKEEGDFIADLINSDSVIDAVEAKVLVSLKNAENHSEGLQILMDSQN